MVAGRPAVTLVQFDSGYARRFSTDVVVNASHKCFQTRLIIRVSQIVMSLK